MPESAAVISLPAEVTMGRAAALVAQVDAAAAAAAGTLRIDAAALAELDTSAIALLLHARRAAQARGLTFELSHAPAKLRQLAQLYGVAELLPPEPGVSAAAVST